jgi:hypothetical protein
MTVGAYNANGGIERLVSLAEPPITPTSFLDSDDKGVMNYALAKEWLEDSGFTPYDQLMSLAWTPSGLLVSGYTGNGNNTAPISVLLTERLGVRWMVTHEGDGLPTPHWMSSPPRKASTAWASPARSAAWLGSAFCKSPNNLTTAAYPTTAPLMPS